MFNTIQEAIDDLKKGKLIVVCDDEDRENEGDLLGIAELATPEAINFMAKYGRGLICVPVSESIAKRLELPLATKSNVGENDTNFTDSIDHVSVTTGISAHERATSIKEIANPLAKAADFRRPGHVFPLIAKNGGVLVRAGHTEAACDLAKLAGFQEAGIICEIMNEDGSMSRLKDLEHYVKEHNLKLITIKDLIEYRFANDCLVNKEVEVPMPTDFGSFNLAAFSNQVDTHTHLAIVKGDIAAAENVLVRVHSECFTGDVLHSQRCDCGEQLDAALEIIEKEGVGVVLYLRQEGRGIGLVNKLKAYNLQDQGYDTVEANQMLGFSPDLRNYGIGAQILSKLGVKNIRLLTNNPKKIVGLEGYGLKVVERVPLQIKSKEHNRRYLDTKKTKMGHLLKDE
jgi:3,4-dihydroxy 2-butanone 4-phosphate synthase/GTP cyclohydrolase II